MIVLVQLVLELLEVELFGKGFHSLHVLTAGQVDWGFWREEGDHLG